MKKALPYILIAALLLFAFRKKKAKTGVEIGPVTGNFEAKVARGSVLLDDAGQIKYVYDWVQIVDVLPGQKKINNQLYNKIKDSSDREGWILTDKLTFI